jgi:hypothetical protein
MNLSGISGVLSASSHTLGLYSSSVSGAALTKTAQASSATSTTSQTSAAKSVSTSGIHDASNSTWLDGVPDSVMNALMSYTSPLQQAWTTLGQDMQSSNYTGALDALNSYTSLLSKSNLYMSASTTPSNVFLNNLKSLGTALDQIHTDTVDDLKSPNSANTQRDQKDVQQAQSLYATVYQSRPDTANEALASLMSQAGTDGFSFVYALKYNQTPTVTVAQLRSEITNIDGVLREKNADIYDALSASGYSKTASTKYADTITGIQNGSDEENANVDKQRADEWIKGLTALGNKARDSRPDIHDENSTNDSIASLLADVLFTSVAKAKQVLTLLDSTDGSGNASSADSSGSGMLVSAIA